MVLSLVAAFDKRGKEAYFQEDTRERTMENAVTWKQVHPAWTVMTDDWGFFERAHEEGGSRWQDYDVFLVICTTAGISSAIWLLTSCVETYKFVQVKWPLALPVFPD